MEREGHYFQPKPDKPFAYNPFLDRDAYLKANSAERVRLKPYTRKQLETHIGERFNVLLSTVRYDIKDGHLYGQDSNEPAVVVFARGVGREGSTQEDITREKAEVFGFAQINENFTSPSAKIGDKRLSLSPPSGSYLHKFYDTHELKEDEGGRYVETRRYSSGLDIGETVLMLKNTGLVDEAYQANPEYSLSHPIKIEANHPKFKTADSIHEYLHKNHEYMSQEDFAQIIKICAPLITSYINTLANNPYDLRSQLLTYNALLFTSELVHDAQKTNDYRFLRGLELKAALSYPTRQELEIMGVQPIRQAMIGCGSSGGFAVNGAEVMNSPFSVSDKTRQEQTTLCCKCPFCNEQVEAIISGGRIQCPNKKCGKSVPYIAQTTKNLM
jgi:hypothetical protein